MNYSNLIIQALDKTKGNFIFRLAECGNTIPMGLNHLGKLLIRFETLPLQSRTPVFKKPPRPALFLVIPKLAKRFLKKISCVQPLISLQQFLQGRLPIQSKVLPMGKQRILLPLNKLPFFARKPGILAFPYRIQRLTQVTHDMKLVKKDGRLRRISPGRVPKRLPHVHDRQSDSFALLRPQPRKEKIHARFRTVFSPKPDGPVPHQIAHHNAVILAFADRNLVDANHLRPRSPNPPELLPHILHLQGLDRPPVQTQLCGYGLNTRIPATTANIKSKPFRAERIIGQPIQPLLLHFPAPSTSDSADLHFQINAQIATGQVANSAGFPVVVGTMDAATSATNRFFPLRMRPMTWARGSPKMPDKVCSGEKPGKQ